MNTVALREAGGVGRGGARVGGQWEREQVRDSEKTIKRKSLTRGTGMQVETRVVAE